jgi:hypothetical protein
LARASGCTAQRFGGRVQWHARREDIFAQSSSGTKATFRGAADASREFRKFDRVDLAELLALVDLAPPRRWYAYHSAYKTAFAACARSTACSGDAALNQRLRQSMPMKALRPRAGK